MNDLKLIIDSFPLTISLNEVDLTQVSPWKKKKEKKRNILDDPLIKLPGVATQ